MRDGQGSPGAGSSVRHRRAAAEAIARAQARQALEARSRAYEAKLADQAARRRAARQARAARRTAPQGEHASGQTRGRDTRRANDYLPADTGQSIATNRPRATRAAVGSYQRAHPNDIVAGLSKLVGANLLAAVTPTFGPTKGFQKRQQKQANLVDLALAKGLYHQAGHDLHHPTSPGAILDLAMVGSGVVGAGGRLAAASRVASEAERGARVRAGLSALGRPAQAADVLPARMLPGDRSGLRYVRLEGHRQQVPLVSPNLSTAIGQHTVDRLTEKIPEVPVIGARARVNRLIRAERVVEAKRAQADLIPLSESARALQGGFLKRKARRISRLPSRNVTAQEMAWQHVADYGYVGEHGVALLDRKIAQLAKRAEVSSERGKAILERRIKLMQAARPHVLNPSDELLHSLELSKASSEAVTASRVGRRALHPTTAEQAVARKIRFLHGAEYVAPTDARLGHATPRLLEARLRQERIAAARERAAEKARKLEFTGEQRKRLGLKSEAMAQREQQLGVYANDLKAQIKAVPKGTDEELQARADAIEARFQRVVDKTGGSGKYKTVNKDLQDKINAESKKRGRMTLSDELRKEAEQRVLSLIQRNSHLPWAKKEQALLDEAAAIRDELSARADRKLGIGDQLHPKLPKAGEAAPPPNPGLILHPHLPTTHDALKYELQRVTQEHRELAGRTRALPVGMPDTHGLRAEVRVAEKALRKLEAQWNAPAADVLEERARLHRALRGGTGAERALLGAKGAPATEQGLAVTGIEDLRGRIDQLTEHIDELRGESPQDLRDLREHVKEMRSELRKLEKPRAHVAPGDLPYAVTAKGEIVHPHAYERAVKLGAAQSVGADKLQGLEKAAAKRVTPVGLVTPPELLPAHATRKEAEKALDAALKDAGLTRHEAGVRRVVTTKDAEPDELTGAAFAKDGVAEATHVTDNPAVVQHVLERGLPIAHGRTDGLVGDLGSSGLHVSDSPQIWTSRSQGKWDFVGRLTEGERSKLANELETQIAKNRSSGYITAPEASRAHHSVDEFRRGHNASLSHVAGQPYNLDASKPEFLRKLGIEPGTQPTHVPVHLQGSFVQLEHGVTPEVLDALKAAGFDGAFTKGGMSTTPQLVVWNNKAIKSFGNWEAPVPHEIQPGPLAFHTPDVPPRTIAQKATGGRFSSLNPKAEPVHASTGELSRAGRQQVGPATHIRDALAEVRSTERSRVGALGVKMSVPFDPATYNEKQWQVIDTLAATPAKDLPYGTKAKIAAEKRAAAEAPIELNDVSTPGDLLSKLQREHKAWVADVFPATPGAVPAEHQLGLRMIRRSTFNALTEASELGRSDNIVARAALGLLDFSNKINRAGLIYLNPSYGPVQGTGNVIYLALQQGPFAVKNIPIYAARLARMSREDRLRADIEVGGGAAAALAHERGGSGPLTHLADAQNALADQQPRRLAWLHEADRMGYTTPEEIHALLTEPKLKPYLNTVSERAQQAMVKFERVPSPVRQAVGRAIFIAPWLEGSTRWLGRIILDHPMNAALAEHIREKIIQRQKQHLGIGKAITGGFIPLGAAAQVGGLTLIPGRNPDSLSPTGSGVGVIKAALETAGLTGPPLHGGTRLLGMAQPTLAAGAAALFRRDPYSGYAYPPGRSQGSIFREQIAGDSAHPTLPLLSTLLTGFRGKPKLDTSKPAKLPTYYPEHGWEAVGKRLLEGSVRERRVIKQAVDAKGAKAAMDTATGGAKKELVAQKAMKEGRDYRNKIDAAARKYGLPGAEKGLPADVRDAIRRRTARYVNYAHAGAKTQEEMFRADNAQLLRWGAITHAVYAAQMAWLATKPSKRAIEHRRSTAGRLYYGSNTLSAVNKQIHDAADRRHGAAPSSSSPSVTSLVWGQ